MFIHRLHTTYFWVFVVVQSLSHVQLFTTPWTAAHQASLFFTISQSLLCPSCPCPSHPLSPTISSSVIPFSPLPSIFSSIRVFFNELALLIRWPKYQSFIFSISPSNEYSGLTSLRIGLIACSPKDSHVSSSTPQFKSINSSVLSLFYGPTLTSIYDYWKNHCFDYRDICLQKSTL